jgi:hypothetical protein
LRRQADDDRACPEFGTLGSDTDAVGILLNRADALPQVDGVAEAFGEVLGHELGAAADAIRLRPAEGPGG